MATHSRAIHTECKTFSVKFDEYTKASDQHILQLKTEAEQCCAKVTEVFAGLRSRVTAELDKVQEATNTISTKDQQSEEAMSMVRSSVEEIQESIKTSFSSWSEEIRQHVGDMVKEMETSAAADCATVSWWD